MDGMMTKEYEVHLKDLLSSTAIVPECLNTATEITGEDVQKTWDYLNSLPRKCSCGRGPVQYEVTSPGVIYDLMCHRCFTETTTGGNVIWIDP